MSRFGVTTLFTVLLEFVNGEVLSLTNYVTNPGFRHRSHRSHTDQSGEVSLDGVGVVDTTYTVVGPRSP